MKTVKDVYAVYKEWPYDEMNFFGYIDGVCSFFERWNGPIRNLICTREGYEAYKARQEKKAEASWYDYEKGEGVPPVGTECEVSNCGNDYIWCKVVFMGSSICLVDHKTHSEQHYHLGSVKFRPLDHDKRTKKVAPMEWLVGSGIDCEFSNASGFDYVGSLKSVSNGDLAPYKDTNNRVFKHCRPRMNHKHVLTDEQVKLIPNCFDIEILCLYKGGECINIVEFKGLKDGYVWEGE